MSVKFSQSSTSRLSEASPWVQELWRRSAISFLQGFPPDVDRFEGLATALDQGGSRAAAFWHIAEWDTEMLGVKCAKVDAAGTVPDGAPNRRLLTRLFSQLGERARQDAVRNVYFRVPSSDLNMARAAEDAGFRTIGVHLDFVQRIDARQNDAETVLPVRLAIGEDGDAVALLGELFETDRFHRDGNFDSEKITTLWRTSARNALQHWADAVYVYVVSDRPVGFVILIRGEAPPGTDAPEAGRIYLIAVLPEFRGRGIGKALVSTAVRHCQRRGIPLLCVGAQSSNEAAIARYQSCGFSLATTFCELSWWVNAHV